MILAAVLCFCAIPAFAEEETPETTYMNSLILYVTSDVQRTFSPSDFSDAGCVKAETTSMCLNDEGKYVYRELLTLDRSGDEAMDDLVKAFDGKVFRNIYADDYYRYANRVNLSANEVYVPLGKTLFGFGHGQRGQRPALPAAVRHRRHRRPRNAGRTTNRPLPKEKFRGSKGMTFMLWPKKML